MSSRTLQQVVRAHADGADSISDQKTDEHLQKTKRGCLGLSRLQVSNFPISQGHVHASQARSLGDNLTLSNLICFCA
jgi:thiamine biosynthesis protein ThiC